MKKTESNEFAMRLIPSVMSILLCLGLLCTTSLAYFTETVTSRSNVIASASYSLTVEPTDPPSKSTAAEPSMIMEDFAGEETTAQTPAVEEEYTPEESESGVAPAAESGVAPAAETGVASAAESGVAPAAETGVAPAAESGIAPAAESDIPEVNAQTGITTTISTASSSKNSNAPYDEEGYEVVDAGISADAVSILTASLTEEEAAEDGGAEPEPITFNYDDAGLYYFKITAHGTAQNGYCKIEVDGTPYYTTKIAPGSSITLGIAVGADSTIKFTAQWGTSAYYAGENTDTKVYGEEGYEVIDHSGKAAQYLSAEQPKGMASDELITADTTVADTTVADTTTDSIVDTTTDNIVDTTTDTTVADNTPTVIDNTTGEITTVVDNTTSDETSGATPGENQGGEDDILTVDAAA